jgi:hypothetical protein
MEPLVAMALPQMELLEVTPHLEMALLVFHHLETKSNAVITLKRVLVTNSQSAMA